MTNVSSLSDNLELLINSLKITKINELINDCEILAIQNIRLKSLLEKSFGQTIGYQSIYNEASCGYQGGLRYILDKMTDYYKMEEVEKHINCVLKSTLNPLDFDEKVYLIKVLMDYIKPSLSDEIISQPPERYASHFEPIIKAYISSFDHINSVFKSL